MNLAILDTEAKDHRAWKAIDINNLQLQERMQKRVFDLYYTCVELGLLYPTVTIRPNHILMKYDYDMCFIKFFVTLTSTLFEYGRLDGDSFNGTLVNPLQQLPILKKFIYQGQKFDKTENRS